MNMNAVSYATGFTGDLWQEQMTDPQLPMGWVTSYDFTSASQEMLAGHHCQMPRVIMRVSPAGMQAARLTSTFRFINLVGSPQRFK